MKRKLIKRNKAKMTKLAIECPILYLLTRDPSHTYFKILHKYHKIEMPERAYRRNEFSKMINVPTEITSKNRRSRVKNLQIYSRVFRNVEQFNEKYGTDKVLTDFRVK